MYILNKNVWFVFSIVTKVGTCYVVNKRAIQLNLTLALSITQTLFHLLLYIHQWKHFRLRHREEIIEE